MRIDADGMTRNGSGVWATLSDARLKKNIAELDVPLDTLLALRGRRFEYIDPEAAMSDPGERIGFVAQEVQAVLPRWVRADRDGILSVVPTGFDALVVEAVREMKQAHDAEVAELRELLTSLRARVAQLERR